MDDFGKDVGKSWRLSRLIPAYRATLLYLPSIRTISRAEMAFYLLQLSAEGDKCLCGQKRGQKFLWSSSLACRATLLLYLEFFHEH